MSKEPLLITGVGKRVGLHLAHTFLDRGIPVIGTYRTTRSSVTELEQKGAELYQCDFDDEQQTDALRMCCATMSVCVRSYTMPLTG